jgi:hypothetical protein
MFIFRLIRLVSFNNSAFLLYFVDYPTNSFAFGQKNRPNFPKFCVVFLYQLLLFSLDYSFKLLYLYIPHPHTKLSRKGGTLSMCG